MASVGRCAAALSGVYFDLHDLNTKQIIVSDDCANITITPFSDGQGKWIVHAPLDCTKGTCAADIDFRVPNKPHPPAASVEAIFDLSSPLPTLLFPGASNVWTRMATPPIPARAIV